MFPLLKVTWNHTLPIYHMRLALVSWVPSVHIVFCIQVLEGDNKAFQVERQITLDKHNKNPFVLFGSRSLIKMVMLTLADIIPCLS